MRTGPVALLTALVRNGLGSPATSPALPTPVPMPSRRVYLWTDAIRRAINGPVAPQGHRLGRPCVRGPRLMSEARPLWSDRLEACYTAPPEESTPTGTS